MFARSDISASVTHLENSQFDERVWVTLGCWCRPPGAGVDTSMNADANRLTVLTYECSLHTARYFHPIDISQHLKSPVSTLTVTNTR